MTIMMTMYRLPAAWATQPVLIALLASCLALKLRPVPVKVDQDCYDGHDDNDHMMLDPTQKDGPPRALCKLTTCYPNFVQQGDSGQED